MDGTVGSTHLGMAAGQYRAIVSDIYGCADSLTVFITSPNPIIMNPLSDTTICLGGTVSLTASANGGTPPINYAWIGGVITGGASIVHNPAVVTTYRVTAFDGNGCLAEDTVLAIAAFYQRSSTTRL